MANENKNTGTNSDDIDLLLLLERSLDFFRRYKWVYFSAIILGIAAGFFLYRTIPKTYESRLVVHSYFLTNQELIQITNNWNGLRRGKEITALARAFNCSEEVVSKLKSIRAKEIQQVFTSSNPNGFTIDVTVTDNSILGTLEKGIVYGFESIPYVKERLDFRKEGYQDLIHKTTTEIAKLDSTKKILENIIGGTARSTGSLVIDGSSVNRQLVEMNEKLLGFKESLRFTTAVQVLQHFSKFNKPADPKLLPLIVIGLAFFLAIAFALTLLHSIDQKLKRRRLGKTL
jgi:hypothetical protein